MKNKITKAINPQTPPKKLADKDSAIKSKGYKPKKAKDVAVEKHLKGSEPKHKQDNLSHIMKFRGR